MKPAAYMRAHRQMWGHSISSRLRAPIKTHSGLRQTNGFKRRMEVLRGALTLAVRSTVSPMESAVTYTASPFLGDRAFSAGPAEDPCSAALEYLLAPTSLQKFFETFYEKTFLHVSGRTSNYLTHCFSRKEAEIVLWQQESRIPNFVRLHNDGSDIAPPRSSSLLDFSKWAFDAYDSGSSIIMNNLEDYYLPLASLMRNLEEFFSSRVSASAYITPEQARAFRAHFDTHDVLILQIEGVKRYRLFGNATSPGLPIKRQFYPLSEEDLGEPSDDIILRAGDLLYIPRGLIHVAHTEEAHSLHISIGLHPPKLADIISTCVELATERNASLRESLYTSDTKVVALVEKLGELLGAELTIEALLARQRLRFTGSLRPLPARQLCRREFAQRLQLEDWVQKTPGSVISTAIIGGNSQFNFPGLGVVRDESILPNRVEAPAALEPAIQFIAGRRAAFQVSELPSLSENAKLVFARSLVRRGLLQEAALPSSSNDAT